MRYLVQEKGMDVNAQDESGMTPLIHAAFFGHKYVVKALLDLGADVNLPGKGGVTVLMATLQNVANGDIARMLIDSGVDVNAGDEQGLTPLMAAIYTDSKEMTLYLLEKGAAVDVKNVKGWTALDLAKQKGNRQLIKILHRAGSFQNADLIYAARIGDIGWLEEMIKGSGDVNARNENQETPLIWASFYGHYKVAKLLLDHGAGVNDRSKGGWTALMAAVETGRKDIVELLLERGADTTNKTDQGDTALTLAQKNDHSHIAAIIQDYGGSVKQ
ncbi:MAG: ankyrin repeat domain-containing protein [Candidatus Syntrophopropionicum ammoniitolerans]